MENENKKEPEATKRFGLFPLLPDEAFNIDFKNDTSVVLQNCETADRLPNNIKVLIARLLSVHYVGTLHTHKSATSSVPDVELSIPDPELLKTDGPKELRSQHLYVNLSKYLNEGHKAAAHCVKTRKHYYVDSLLQMKPLLDRTSELGWDPSRYTRHIKQRLLIPSLMGDAEEEASEITTDIISPGTLIPITQLPSTHPAIMYLNSRGYTDLESLENQFSCGFCSEENPQFKHIFGRDTASAKANFDPITYPSPQGRIVFFAKHFGVNALWQARVIEFVAGDDKFYYYHDAHDLSKCGLRLVAKYNSELKKFVAVPGVSNSAIKKKYVIAPGAKASQCLIGFDAALEWNKKHNTIKKVIGLCEGVLDAARLGPPFCSIMGAGVSNGQLYTIANTFDKVYFACDHDDAGNALRDTLVDNPIISLLELEEVNYPSCYKDLGEMKSDYQYLINIKNRILSDNIIEREEGLHVE